MDEVLSRKENGKTKLKRQNINTAIKDIEKDVERRKLREKAVILFNTNWKKGLHFLKTESVLEDNDAATISHFLLTEPGLDRKQCGELIGDENELDIRNAYCRLFDFKGRTIESGLRYFLSFFYLPNLPMKIDRIFERFSYAYKLDNEDSPLTCHQVNEVTQMLILVNSILHSSNPQIRHQINKESFIKNILKESIPLQSASLSKMYDNVAAYPFRCEFRDAEKIYSRLARDPRIIRELLDKTKFDETKLYAGSLFIKISRNGVKQHRLVWIECVKSPPHGENPSAIETGHTPHPETAASPLPPSSPTAHSILPPSAPLPLPPPSPIHSPSPSPLPSSEPLHSNSPPPATSPLHPTSNKQTTNKTTDYANYTIHWCKAIQSNANVRIMDKKKPRSLSLNNLVALRVGNHASKKLIKAKLPDEWDQKTFSLIFLQQPTPNTGGSSSTLSSQKFFTLDLCMPQEHQHVKLASWHSFFHQIIKNNLKMYKSKISSKEDLIQLLKNADSRVKIEDDINQSIWLRKIAHNWSSHWAAAGPNPVGAFRSQVYNFFLPICQSRKGENKGDEEFSSLKTNSRLLFFDDKKINKTKFANIDQYDTHQKSLFKSTNSTTTQHNHYSNTSIPFFKNFLDRGSRIDTAKTPEIVALWKKGLPSDIRTKLWPIALYTENFQTNLRQLRYLIALANSIRNKKRPTATGSSEQILEDNEDETMIATNLHSLDEDLLDPSESMIESFLSENSLMGGIIENHKVFARQKFNLNSTNDTASTGRKAPNYTPYDFSHTLFSICADEMVEGLLKYAVEEEILSEAFSTTTLPTQELSIQQNPVSSSNSNSNLLPSNSLTNAIREIVSAFLILRPEIGYSRVLIDISGILLFYMDMETSFQCLTTLLQKSIIYDMYLFDRNSVQWTRLRIDFFTEYLRIHIPGVHQHFSVLGITGETYILPWISSLFVKVLPLPLLCTVWDQFFLFGDVFAFQIALGLIKYYEHSLISTSFSGCVKILFDRHWDLLLDMDGFLACVFSCSIDPDEYANWMAEKRIGAHQKTSLLELALMSE